MIALAFMAAAAAAGGFHPPLDRPVRFRTTQAAAGQPAFSMVEEVRFAAEPGGYLMSLTTISSGAAGRSRAARSFDITNHAFDGLVARYHVSAGGRVTGVEQADALWDAVIASVDRWIAAHPRMTAAALAPIRAFRGGLAATPGPQRAALLLDNAEALLAPPLPAGEAPLVYKDSVPDRSGAPVAVTGTLRRVEGTGAVIGFVAEADSAAATGSAPVHERREFGVSAADGLLVSAHRVIAAGAGTAPLLDERLERLALGI